jgi:hypothetical protein
VYMVIRGFHCRNVPISLVSAAFRTKGNSTLRAVTFSSSVVQVCLLVRYRVAPRHCAMPCDAAPHPTTQTLSPARLTAYVYSSARQQLDRYSRNLTRGEFYQNLPTYSGFGSYRTITDTSMTTRKCMFVRISRVIHQIRI